MSSQPQHPNQPQDQDAVEAVVSEISPQSRDMVDRNLPNASDDVKQATMALVDAIRKRAKAQAKVTGRWTKETYLEAAQQAKDLLSRREELAQKYRNQLDNALQWIEEEANQRWEPLSAETESWGERLSKAADAAWKILTGTQNPELDDEPDSASTCPKGCATAQKRALSAYDVVNKGMQDEDQD